MRFWILDTSATPFVCCPSGQAIRMQLSTGFGFFLYYVVLGCVLDIDNPYAVRNTRHTTQIVQLILNILLSFNV